MRAAMTALHDLTIAEAAPLLKAKKLSPVELTASYLSRIDAFDGQLNAYIRVLPEQAMAAARKAMPAGAWIAYRRNTKSVRVERIVRHVSKENNTKNI